MKYKKIIHDLKLARDWIELNSSNNVLVIKSLEESIANLEKAER